MVLIAALLLQLISAVFALQNPLCGSTIALTAGQTYSFNKTQVTNGACAFTFKAPSTSAGISGSCTTRMAAQNWLLGCTSDYVRFLSQYIFCGDSTITLTVGTSLSMDYKLVNQGTWLSCQLQVAGASVATTTAAPTIITTTTTSAAAPTTTTAASATTTASPSGSTSAPRTCECGKKKTSRIVGGTEAVPNSSPWQARLICCTAASVCYMCGGTVISPNYVLTAAHCLNDGIVKCYTYLGDHNTGIAESTEKVLISTQFVLHTNYDPNTKANDIALVKLPTPVEYTDAIQPACLPFNQATNTFTGNTTTATGWGKTSSGGSTSNVLLQVDLTVMSNTACSQYYNLMPSMMCATGTNKDTCQGDSGGPLSCTMPDPAIAGEGITYCVGVVSYGSGCGTYPGVYTRVTSFLDWVTANTNSETFCKI